MEANKASKRSEKRSAVLILRFGRATGISPTAESIQAPVATKCLLSSLEHLMLNLNSALFEPLTRIENACRRVSGVMLTAPNIAPKDIELVRREIQEDQGSPGSVQDRGGSP